VPKSSRRSPGDLLKKVFPPMLATLVAEIPAQESSWAYELKYDGFRALAGIVDGEIALLSRNELDLAPRFPQIALSLSGMKVHEAVIDGEIVALDPKGAPRFQLLQQGGEQIIFAFDLLWLDGKDLRKLPYESRRELLARLLKRAPAGVRLAAQMPPPGATALEHAAAAGFEGLIAKRLGSIYEGRRSKDWLKIKAVNQQELAIVGYNPSTHSSRELGALHLAVAEEGRLVYAGKVGTGFDAKQRAGLKESLDNDVIATPAVEGAPRVKAAIWVEPRLVAQVRFAEWTSDGMLRHPSFLGLRPDKKPMECVREWPQRLKRAARATAPETKRAPEAKKTSSGSGRSGSPLRDGLAAAKSEIRAPAVILTNPGRILFPRDKITKREVADYYLAVAEPMIRALNDRPLALEHWNQGIDKPSWFQQDIGSRADPWLTLIQTPTRTSNRTVSHLTVDRPETLLWLAQHSVLTIHMWSSRGTSLESPDWVVFDLDPAKGKGIEQAVDAALVMRGLLEQLELPCVPKTSGKRGIHLLVPIAPGYTHEEAADFATALGAAVAQHVPEVTTERSIVRRRGRLYLDCLQNSYGKTIVAPYSPRAIEGAPVSAPLQWSEINKKLDPSRFNIRTMPDRLAKLGDLFGRATEKGVKLPVLKT
jgi:bifunctional non-homologous end joining protein LigD